jgi:hypothetical protein
MGNDNHVVVSHKLCGFSGMCGRARCLLLVFGRPEHLSSSTDTRQALERECYSKTAVRLIECSPKASRSI